jgi:uncharacterized protein YyaL (SSP411 family)
VCANDVDCFLDAGDDVFDHDKISRPAKFENRGAGRSVESQGQKFLGEGNEAIRAMSMVDGESAAYVCENFTCKAPVTDPRALSELVSK